MACLLFLFSLIRIENRIEAQSRPALEKFSVPYDGGYTDMDENIGE